MSFFKSSLLRNVNKYLREKLSNVLSTTSIIFLDTIAEKLLHILIHPENTPPTHHLVPTQLTIAHMVNPLIIIFLLPYNYFSHTID